MGDELRKWKNSWGSGRVRRQWQEDPAAPVNLTPLGQLAKFSQRNVDSTWKKWSVGGEEDPIPEENCGWMILEANKRVKSLYSSAGRPIPQENPSSLPAAPVNLTDESADKGQLTYVVLNP